MRVGDTLSALGNSEISVGDAISIIIISGPLGAIFGGSFTIHIVSEETTAIWLTTVAFAVLGMIIWSYRF
jgi:hypothetical protein